MLRFTVFILFALILSQAAHSQEIKGRITDAASHEPLAFVNILYNDGRQGTVSSVDGTFEITNTTGIRSLTFSYVGYEVMTIPVTPEIYGRNLSIQLKFIKYKIDEVTVRPGVNPAHRIINKVIENRDRNNPEKMHSFSYTAYNKMYFTLQEDTFANRDKFAKMVDSLSLDPGEKNLQSFLKRQHLFLSEFVSQRYFKYPSKNSEKVISSRISGLTDPSFILLATQMQSFSFYDEYVTLLNKRYLNPISNGSTSWYFFLLEDTFYTETADTLFVISYRPYRGKNFDGLRGVLYINSNGYAIQNVIASPARAEENLSIRIQQRYEFIDHKQWFPTQLNTDVLFKNLKVHTGAHERFITGIGKSYLTHIKLDPDVSDVKFSNVEVEVKKERRSYEDSLLKVYRAVPLTPKDSNTYHIVDSVGRAQHLDEKMKAVESLINGYIPWKIFNIDYRKFFTYNKYMGLRLGLGLYTNKRVSQNFSLGGYCSYGFGDKSWRYAGELQVFPHWYSDTRLTLRYFNELSEPGSYNFLDNYILNSTEFLRQYYIDRMDKISGSYASISFRAMRSFKFSFYLSQQHRLVSDYSWIPLITMSDTTGNSFSVTEAGVQVKLGIGEKFVKTPSGMLVSTGTRWPILWLNVRKGLSAAGGGITYTKTEAKINKAFVTKRLGETRLTAVTGKLWGNVPVSLLYSGLGNYSYFGFDAETSFGTMRPSEFFSDEFVSLFFRQNFGKLIINSPNFAPEFCLITNAGWGRLSNRADHAGFTFNTMEKGYYESGMLINNLLNVSYLGLGIGVYYRYGPYSFLKTADNFAYKISMSYRF